MTALLLALVLMFMSVSSAHSKLKRDTLTLKTSTGSHVISIEIAETDADKALGLMYRQQVAPDSGMLFPYGKPQELTMWMRNTYASLDMVFIRPDGVVHRVEKGTEPLSERIISSNGPVSAVLELAAGEADRLGLKPGDVVQHSVFKNARR